MIRFQARLRCFGDNITFYIRSTTVSCMEGLKKGLLFISKCHVTWGRRGSGGGRRWVAPPNGLVYSEKVTASGSDPEVEPQMWQRPHQMWFNTVVTHLWRHRNLNIASLSHPLQGFSSCWGYRLLTNLCLFPLIRATTTFAWATRRRTTRRFAVNAPLPGALQMRRARRETFTQAFQKKTPEMPQFQAV